MRDTLYLSPHSRSSEVAENKTLKYPHAGEIGESVG